VCVFIEDPLQRGRPCKLAREEKGVFGAFLLQRIKEPSRDHASLRSRRWYRYLSEPPPQVTVHSKSEGNHLQDAVRKLRRAGPLCMPAFSPLSLLVLPDDSSPYDGEEKSWKLVYKVFLIHKISFSFCRSSPMAGITLLSGVGASMVRFYKRRPK
jgi:hypothetical protein